MAKVASSKPFETGNSRKPNSPAKKTRASTVVEGETSPNKARMSPRRRAATEDRLTISSPRQPKKSDKRSIPKAPVFSETPTRAEPVKNVEKSVSSRKSPRKTTEKPAVDASSEMPEEEASPEMPDEVTSPRKSSRKSPVNSPKKYPRKPQKLPKSPKEADSEPDRQDEKETVEPLSPRRSPRRTSVDTGRTLVAEIFKSESIEESTDTSIYQESENSPVFEESVVEAEQIFEEDTENPFLEAESDDFEHGPSEYSSDESDDDLGTEYNSQFRRNSSSAAVIKERIRQYFARREQRSSEEPPVWSRVRSWIGEIGEKVIPMTKDLTNSTLEFTRSTIEQLNQRIRQSRNQQESRIKQEYEEPQYEEKIVDEEMNESVHEEQVIEEKEFEEVNLQEMESKRIKIDAEPLQFSLPEASFETVPVATPFKIVDLAVEARLTEIVLFFARCNATTPTPLIYEYLEEFFRLKESTPMNPTERQLIHNVLKDNLMVGSITLTPTVAPSLVDEQGLAYKEESRRMTEMINTSAIINESPHRLTTLRVSGVRFRAPTFTSEEEARIEELESAFKSKSSKQRTFATSGVRSRLQRKLLDLDRTIEIFESIPTVGDSRDFVQSAIDSIVSEKVSQISKENSY